MTRSGHDGGGELLAVRGLTKIYATRRSRVVAFDNLSFDVSPGRILSVIGSSGCGKSTLLKCIAGLVPVTGGAITVAGEDVTIPSADSGGSNGSRPSGGNRTGFVFQEPRLLPWQTVRQNVAFGLRSALGKGLERNEIRARVDRLLDLVRLTESAAAYPGELSGGMRQRVALARGLAIDPDLLLMDEPLSALDELTRKRLQEELLDIIAAAGKTAVWVTHDLDEALVTGDEVLVLGGQPGTVVARFEVPFGRPRRTVSLSKTTEYVDLRIRLLEALSGAESVELPSP